MIVRCTTDWKDATMEGMAGVTIVRSKADSRTDRQSGIMIKAVAVGESFRWPAESESSWDMANRLLEEPYSCLSVILRLLANSARIMPSSSSSGLLFAFLGAAAVGPATGTEVDA